ncbi:MAG TPA: hypothetical protein PLP87_01875 [Clostridiales bacterium]|nr:hypothetical protein [Clostridiales bacterium]
MNSYVSISRELRSFFSTNRILRYIFPLDVIIMFASLILIFLNNTVGVNIGGFLSALTYWTFILGLLMTYASLKERPLYIGLFGYGAIHLISFLISLFRYGYFSCYSFFRFAVYAGLGWLVLRKVLAGTAGRAK